MVDTIFLEVPDGAVWPVKLTMRLRDLVAKGLARICEILLPKVWLLVILHTWRETFPFQSYFHEKYSRDEVHFSSSTDDEAEVYCSPSSETEDQGMKHDMENRTHGGDHGGKSTTLRSKAPLALRTFAKTELEDLAYSKA
ncbi:Hypothetical predicted protein [Prunus dulcis]|uniref:Uncharacterized protein n=1 Tax=Prunus dulcis TaxID=3755 RepID=A0A5E4FNK4_PRUDU|nr:Hypothetical predicted protein [Prunus dulcis]